MTSSYVPVATVAPALYTLNGTQTNVPVYTVNSDNSLSAAPIRFI
jgi:hypothetical protein